MLPHQFFKLLADETRVRCLLLIMRKQPICVAEFVSALEESQPKISRHLALLRASGIVQDCRKGQWVYYRLADDLPGWMNKQINDMAASRCLAKQYQEDTNRLQQFSQQNTCC